MDIVYLIAGLIINALITLLLLKMFLKGDRSGRDEAVTKLSEDVSQLKESLARVGDDIRNMKLESENSSSILRKEISESIQSNIKSLGNMLLESQKNYSELQNSTIRAGGENTMKQMESIHGAITKQLTQMNLNIEERLKTSSLESENKLEAIRKTVETKLTGIQEDNNKKLDEMRSVVDEKLQKTLEERISKSFELVNTQLEAVYKGLGEMQNLASGVGDLKKVLSNVKTRGILGEIQLGAILEEILSPEQYETNFVTKKGSKNPVEYAVKIPTEDGKGVYLPIDSKFPGDAYINLTEAYDSGSREAVNEAVKTLVQRIKSFAKDISDKYIDPPNTTDFAIMFLPFEGLYAEVVNRGLVEELQRSYRVNIAGPSTMAALLNSLQMGFRTFAIQKRSGEVWEVLGAVKTEFGKFGAVLEKTQKRLEEANRELDNLVGVRTRQIQRKLKSVESISADMSQKMFLDVESAAMDEEEQ